MMLHELKKRRALDSARPAAACGSSFELGTVPGRAGRRSSTKTTARRPFCFATALMVSTSISGRSL